MDKFYLKCMRCSDNVTMCYRTYKKYNGNEYVCDSCNSYTVLENKTRSCPICKNDIIYQSPSAKKRADQLNSKCINCTRDQIPKSFSIEQEEFLNGLMLGDGCVQYSDKIRKEKANPRLCLIRQGKDIEYLYWQYSLFKDFHLTAPRLYNYYDERTCKTYTRGSLNARSGSVFKKIHEKWYLGNKKIVPKDLKLTPLTLLIWFLDDGCICFANEKKLYVKFSTDGFTKEEVEFLVALLNSYFSTIVNVTGKKFHLNYNGSYPIIKASTILAIEIIKIIDPIFPECMQRKRTWLNSEFIKNLLKKEI